MTTRAVAGIGLTAVAVFALLVGAYANHFHNGFHFDDDHTIVNNVYVRDIRYVPRYFTDATTSSVLPSNRAYRPVLQTTFALDYWLAGGYRPLAFQMDTFVWFVAELAAIWWLFACIAKASDGDAAFAALPTAIYALHPACAETINYIVQRGEVISTGGVALGLAIFAGAPALRRSLLYLVPVAIAILAKPPAMVFPALLFAYVYWFEPHAYAGMGWPGQARRPRASLAAAAARVALPSLVLVAALGIWSAGRTPSTFVSGGGSAAAYWLSQPFVALRYFASFFAPIALSADNDWHPLQRIVDRDALLGAAFIATLLWVIRRTARRADTRPIAFGLAWFVTAQVPTALMPLAEVGNDHRMFFPFVGLALAVCWPAYRWWRTHGAFVTRPVATAAVVAALLVVEAIGVRARNEVWQTDEALWRDVTIKSPTNGRGLMNYGLTRMAAGDLATAIAYFERALAFTPNYPLLHVNLGIAYGAVGRLVDAEREFRQAVRLAPEDWRSHLYYGRGLRQIRRSDDALVELQLAARQNPADLETSRELQAIRELPAGSTPDSLLARSLAAYRAGRFQDCVDFAREALTLKPGYAEAYNNIAAGYIALGRWDEGIEAAEEALRLKPDLAIARNNIAFARQRKQQRGR